ncbi:MAG TPA: FCD domain-containing protein [Streptosporangiaceae bacterium]|jgi:DNA-binding FadR family transcriptional regulator
MGTSADLFNPVNDRRISELIVDQVRLLIRQQHLNPGDRLPAERELCERFGVSRVTVREALRVLEANGLVEIRVGARGGAFVTTPSRERVGEGIADLLTLSAVTAHEVTEARLILELGMVPLVCERADDDDIAALLDICDRQESALAAGDYQINLSAEFHSRLAECAHNAAVHMLIQSFRGPLLMSLERAQQTAPEMGRKGAKEHREIVHAIQRRDVDQTTEIMRRHLARTAQRVKDL